MVARHLTGTLSARRRLRTRAAAVLGGLALLVGTAAVVPLTAAEASVTFPPEFRVTEVTHALKQPHAMKFAPDGRLFVLEQRGTVRIVKNGVLLPKPALTLPVPSGGSRGLLGLTFDPAFATNGYVYLFYTVNAPIPAEPDPDPEPGTEPPPPPPSVLHNVVSRFIMTGDTIAPDPQAEKFTLHLDPLGDSTMHYGGELGFGPDGKLYVSVGDNLKGPNAQNLETRFGKILRYNADLSIPSDNPFSTTAKPSPVWAIGVRNPFRMSFQPGTGAMFIGDVGSAGFEEVNVIRAGQNYGWPEAEGPSDDPDYVDPLLAYPHTPTGTDAPYGCAVMGGDFYAPAQPTFPARFRNKYLFGDHCLGWVRVLDPATGQSTPFASGFEDLVDLKVGPDGSLYTLQRKLNDVAQGVLYKVTFDGAADLPPQIGSQPADVTVGPGGSATFSVLASGTAPLTYQWRRNGVAIPGATADSYTVAHVTPADSGARFSVQVRNPHATVTSDDAVLTVADNQVPSATITSPAEGVTYKAGKTVTIAGLGTDPEDGTLPLNAYEWEVVFHHNTHTHPHVEAFTGVKKFTTTIPVDNETATDVFYRIHLRVTDSTGLVTESTRDISPQISTAKVQAQPYKFSLRLDGQPFEAPGSFDGVVGGRRILTAPLEGEVNGKAWVFDCWEDFSTENEHPIFMPANSKGLYTAFYRRNAGSIGTGTGLRAKYFSTPDFSGEPALDRVDRVIFHSWSGSPKKEVLPADNFSVRWTGDLQAQFSGAHTFYMQANDKAKVTLRDEAGRTTTLFDTFTTPSNAPELTAPFTVTAGKRYAVTIEFVDVAGAANMRLLWSGPGLPKSAIPGSQWYPATG